MKRVIVSLLAATCLSTAAFAADLPSRRQAPAAYVPPVFTWTGFYAGVNAGYAWNGDSDLKDVNYHVNGVNFNVGNGAFVSRDTNNDGSFTGGAQVGYNYQMGSVVLGVETDFNYINAEKKYDAQGAYFNNAGTFGHEVNAESKVEWFGTVRGRIGYTPVDRLMVFVTGGLAYGSIKNKISYTDFGNGYSFYGSKSDTRAGWTLGAGAEYAITNNITVKGEYAYVDLGDNTLQVVNRANEHVSMKESTNFHVVRAGVNYKF